MRLRCRPKINPGAGTTEPPKLMSLADWAGPPDDSTLPGSKEQPPPPTPLDPLGLSSAALGGASHQAVASHNPRMQSKPPAPVLTHRAVC